MGMNLRGRDVPGGRDAGTLGAPRGGTLLVYLTGGAPPQRLRVAGAPAARADGPDPWAAAPWAYDAVRRALARCGATPDAPRVEVLDARGWAAGRRAVFDALLARVEGGDVGAVVLGSLTALGSVPGDGERLLASCWIAGTPLVDAHAVYDLRRPEAWGLASLRLLFAAPPSWPACPPVAEVPVVPASGRPGSAPRGAFRSFPGPQPGSDDAGRLEGRASGRSNARSDARSDARPGVEGTGGTGGGTSGPAGRGAARRGDGAAPAARGGARRARAGAAPRRGPDVAGGSAAACPAVAGPGGAGAPAVDGGAPGAAVGATTAAPGAERGGAA